MNEKMFLALALVAAASVAAAGPRGTVPKSAASLYAAHTEKDGVSVGALLLTSAEVRKKFVSDVNRCCVVVEVAVYPAKDKTQQVSLNDFSLRVVGADEAVKPSTAKIVATSIQKSIESQRDITVSPSVGVGYESGTYIDPITGMPTRVHGVYTQVGVGVGVGGSGPQPGSSERDRDTMETELIEKGLPDGSTSTPVAGYLYFSLAKKKNMLFQLEWLLNGNKTTLTLP